MAHTDERRRPGTLNRELMRAPKIDANGDYEGEDTRFTVAELDEAHVVNSRLIGTELHAPVLDLDFEAELVPSTTPGHYHLYLDKPMSAADYDKLLNVLREVGILEDGYVGASLMRGYSSARLPWIKKGDVPLAATAPESVDQEGPF